MKNKKNIQEINSLLSVLNTKIKDINDKHTKIQEDAPKKALKFSKIIPKQKAKSNKNLPEKPFFGTKIFKNPELIFKPSKEQYEDNKSPKFDKENSKILLKNNKINIKIADKKDLNLDKKLRNETLEEVEDRIKDLHLRSENALLRFVEIRQDLLKSKENIEHNKNVNKKN